MNHNAKIKQKKNISNFPFDINYKKWPKAAKQKKKALTIYLR